MATGTWTALPSGDDVSITPGGTYAIVASVASSTTEDKLTSAMAQYFPGASLVSYVEQGESGGPPADPDSTRKSIAVIVSAGSFSGTLAWSKGVVLLDPNIYTLDDAWVLSPSGSSTPPTAPWAGAVLYRKSSNPWGWVFGVGIIVAAGATVYHWREDFARALRGKAT